MSSTPTPRGVPLVIAIDGPAASGKGTLAKRVAQKYGFAHLDTGKLYRAVAYLVLEASCDPSDKEAAIDAAERITPELLLLPALSRAEVGRTSSIVAAIGEVRASLLAYQRAFAAHPPGGKPGAVLDGRDIGSVICPNARVKLFVTARPEVRAQRRFLELKAAGSPLGESEILADIKERDQRDSSRKDAPLIQAPGAYLLDTSDLSIEAAFAAACAIIEEQLKSGAASKG
ncbi:MAG TPA: (d)CMP kinase [Alphaproteobacteria bacterium]|nr:(d)CMP kinase [Alphaproteobacteria bacterium]